MSISFALKNILEKKLEFNFSTVECVLNPIIMPALMSTSSRLRIAGAICIGSIAAVSGPLRVNGLIKDLINKLKKNRNPIARTGFCLSLGTIINFGGRECATRQLQISLSILSALAKDLSTIVQNWALRSICYITESIAFSNNPVLLDQYFKGMYNHNIYQ